VEQRVENLTLTLSVPLYTFKGYNMELNQHDKQVGATAVESYKAQLLAEQNDETAKSNEDYVDSIIEALDRVKGTQFKGTLEQFRFNRSMGDATEVAEEELFDLDAEQLGITLANLRRVNTEDSNLLARQIDSDFRKMSENTLL